MIPYVLRYMLALIIGTVLSLSYASRDLPGYEGILGAMFVVALLPVVSLVFGVLWPETSWGWGLFVTAPTLALNLERAILIVLMMVVSCVISYVGSHWSVRRRLRAQDPYGVAGKHPPS